MKQVTNEKTLTIKVPNRIAYGGYESRKELYDYIMKDIQRQLLGTIPSNLRIMLEPETYYDYESGALRLIVKAQWVTDEPDKPAEV